MKHLGLLGLLLMCQPPMKVLKVMTFNIFRGGDRVAFSTITKAVQAADADVVVIQESFGKSQQLATELGWAHVSADIISRRPITVISGRIVIEGVTFVNVKLPAENYGPYVTQTLPDLDVQAQEVATRLPALTALLGPVKAVERVIVAGDFNAPSHLDWTPETVGIRPQVAYSMRWPTSVLMHQHGYVDTYRWVYPDPRKNPGLTWWAAFQPVTEPRDRIDFIYSKGVEVLDSRLIGADESSPWGTDHNAVVTTFGIPA